MVGYNELKRDNVLGKTCRQCLNERYHLRLEPKDCAYHDYKYPCSNCGQISNIVTRIRPGSRWKLLLGRQR